MSDHELAFEVRELRLRIASLENRVAEAERLVAEQGEDICRLQAIRTRARGSGKLEDAFGKWPGDETDDEIFEMLEEIS